MQRLSKGFYLSSPIVGIFSVVMFGIAWIAIISGATPDNFNPGFDVLVVLGMVGALFGGIVNLIFIYKIWDAIADQNARTTAGKAVGFLFIPFFGMYWIFQILWGFAKDCNAYIDRHSINAPKLPAGLFLACAILPFASFIPFVGIAALIVFAIAISKTCDTLNAFGQDSVDEGKAATLPLYFLSDKIVT